MIKRIKFFVLFVLLCVGQSVKAEDTWCNHELTNGDKTIYVSLEEIKEGVSYRITITGTNLTGLGGSYLNTYSSSGGATNTSLSTYATVSADGTSIVINLSSASAPQFYTPLYVMVSGSQVTFATADEMKAGIWGLCEGTVLDEVLPEMVSATVVESKLTYNSAQISVSATDLDGDGVSTEVSKYLVMNGETELGTYTAVDGVITISGLTDETSYTLTVYAVDNSANVSSSGIVVTFTTTEIVTWCDYEIVNGSNTIYVSLEVIEDGASYRITIRGTNLTSIGGSFVNTYSSTGSSVSTQLNNTDSDAGHSVMTVADDNTSIVIDFSSTSAPKFYTPLYVNISGSGQVTFATADEMNAGIWGVCYRDSSNPVMTSAELVEGSLTYTSLQIAVSATDYDEYDELADVTDFLVKSDDTEIGTYTAEDGVITVTGLEEATTLTVYAVDNSGNISESGIDVEFIILDDETKPEMVSASVVTASLTFSSAQILVSATDVDGYEESTEVSKFQVISADTLFGTFTAVDGAITLTGLSDATKYTITIYAVDNSDNVSLSGIDVTFTTIQLGPTTASPTPTNDQSNVISAYCDSYTTGVEGFGATESWSLAATYSTISGNNYAIVDFSTSSEQVAFSYTQMDISAMEYLYCDLWVDEDTKITISLLTNQADGTSSTPIEGSSYSLTAGEWNTITIPLSEYIEGTSYHLQYQKGVRFNSMTVPGKLYVDNIIFYNIPEDDENPPVMTSATVESTTYNSVTIAVAATDDLAAADKITYQVYEGTTDMGLYTAEDGEITITGLVQNTTYTFDIYAKDLGNNLSVDPIQVTFTTAVDNSIPAITATDPAYNSANVISVYSDVYTSGVGTVSNLWGTCNYTTVGSNNVAYVDFTSSKECAFIFNYNSLGSDVSSMEYLSLDIWLKEDASYQQIQVAFNTYKDGGGSTASENILVDITAGQWTNIIIDFDDFTYSGGDELDYEHIYGVKLTTSTGSSVTDFVAYVDNIIFYRDPTTIEVEADTDYFGSDITEGSHVVLPENSSLTCAYDRSYASITLEAGAKLNVSNGAHLTITDDPIVLNITGDTDVAEIVNNGTIYADLQIARTFNSDRYYFVSLPYDCNVSDITDADGNTLVLYNGLNGSTADIDVVYYDGDARANNATAIANGTASAWKSLGEYDVMKAGVGYNLMVANNSTTLYFPEVDISTIDQATTSDVAIYDATEKDNEGWNLISHSQLYTFDESSFSGSGAVNYVSYFNGESYTQTTVANATLLPFVPFFVQVGESGTLSYAATSSVYTAPALSQAATTETFNFTVAVYNDTVLVDNTTLIVSDNYTTNYEIGADLSKMLTTGSDYPQIYSSYGDTQYAFNAMPSSAITTTNLGVYLPSAATYTLSLDIDNEAYQYIYLVDNTTGMKHNLINGAYIFTTDAAVDDAARFSIAISYVATESVTTENNDYVVYTSNGAINIENLSGTASVAVYDVSGRLLMQQQASGATLNINTLPSGIYMVRIVDAASAATYKVNLMR
ncbi:MAG: T9SS type A sorting domain-containing protein [bacterium]